MKEFEIIAAVDAEGGIGKEGSLPWHLKADLRRFKDITSKITDENKKNAVIMGRKTWESLPKQFRPLPNRANIVLTRNQNYGLHEGALRAGSLEEAFALIEQGALKNKVEKVFVIGGAEVFKEALNNPHCNHIYLTRINQSFHCDVFFPPIDEQFEETSSSVQKEDEISYSFLDFARKRSN